MKSNYRTIKLKIEFLDVYLNVNCIFISQQKTIIHERVALFSK